MGEPTAIYMSLMEQIDLRRRKLKMPAWKLDDLSGLEDGYSQKMLHADAPSGRQAGWRMIDYVVGALYPHGVRVKLIACRKPMQATAGVNGKKPRHFEISQPAPKLVRDYLRERHRELGKQGGRARMASMSKKQRSELARRASVARWADLKAAVAAKKKPGRRGRSPTVIRSNRAIENKQRSIRSRLQSPPVL
jgi:hypothetical protein